MPAICASTVHKIDKTESGNENMAADTQGAIAERVHGDSPSAATRYWLPNDAPISLIGPNAEWFSTERDDHAVRIKPVGPLPSRCLIRPVALFEQAGGFPDVNTVMGKLLFSPGATEAQEYRPFTYDPHRRFRELLLLVEPTPYDDLPTSEARWRSFEVVAKRLTGAAKLDWPGLSARDLRELSSEDVWLQPVEGCVLHALAKASAPVGRCVMEIGSLKGQSSGMLARGLRSAESDKPLISIDPHSEQPLNRDAVRHHLDRMQEGTRLVQFNCRSDRVTGLFAPESVGLVFIDGDHAYSQVVSDFSNFAPLVAPSGFLAFHDYGYGPHNGRADVVPDVRPAIHEHVMGHPDFEPLLLAHTLMAFRKRK